MSKVICDVCGTTYPETATQCPICGTAKNGVTQTVAAATTAEAAGSSYSYVKGGRFSEKNVRRRNDRNRNADRRSDRKRNSSDEEKSNVGLIIIVIILLIAIIAVVANLAVRYLGGNNSNEPEETGTSQTTEPSDSQATEDTTPSEPATVPCESLDISSETIQLLGAGDTWRLTARPAPENTTDAITYTSSDPAVVTVDATGLMTAVGHGEATVTVTCGSVTQTCTVICSFGSEPTEPPVTGEFVFTFNTRFKDETTGKYDTTISKAGETWKAYTNDLNVAPELITWISDDPNVCTVENGIVTAVGPGKTEVHAQYNGVTYTCVVRCSFKTGEGGNNDTPAPTGDCTISHEDVTLPVGESFTLRLKDSNGETLEVTWSADKSGHVTIKGNKITGVAAINGYVTVSTTYEGVTYSCKVRVK